MTYRITRTHEIDAGHRVCGHLGKCAHLHGHRYVFEIVCEADALDELGMVTDFGVIKSHIGMWLDQNWDHRMLLWDNDPMLIRLRDIDPAVVGVEMNPTAENLARMCYQAASRLLADEPIRIVSVTVQETAKCSATYTPG